MKACPWIIEWVGQDGNWVEVAKTDREGNAAAVATALAMGRGTARYVRKGETGSHQVYRQDGEYRKEGIK